MGVSVVRICPPGRGLIAGSTGKLFAEASVFLPNELPEFSRTSDGAVNINVTLKKNIGLSDLRHEMNISFISAYMHPAYGRMGGRQ